MDMCVIVPAFAMTDEINAKIVHYAFNHALLTSVF